MSEILWWACAIFASTGFCVMVVAWTIQISTSLWKVCLWIVR